VSAATVDGRPRHHGGGAQLAHEHRVGHPPVESRERGVNGENIRGREGRSIEHDAAFCNQRADGKALNLLASRRCRFTSR